MKKKILKSRFLLLCSEERKSLISRSTCTVKQLGTYLNIMKPAARTTGFDISLYTLENKQQFKDKTTDKKRNKTGFNLFKMKIEGFHGYNVKFSPHSPFELGIVGGCNFGMTGNDIGDSEQFTTCFHGKRNPKFHEN